MREVTAIMFSPDSVEISYTDRSQVKAIAGQPVMVASTVIVGRDNEAYEDMIAELADDAAELLGDVLEDHARADVFEADDPTEAEEDLGMGAG